MDVESTSRTFFFKKKVKKYVTKNEKKKYFFFFEKKKVLFYPFGCGFIFRENFSFGDMTLVTYRRKSFSMREDDSCAPHSPHTLCQYNRLDRLVWEGLGFLLSLSSILNNFERSFIYFSKKKKKKKKESLEGSRFHRQKNPPYSNPNLCIVV